MGAIPRYYDFKGGHENVIRRYYAVKGGREISIRRYHVVNGRQIKRFPQLLRAENQYPQVLPLLHYGGREAGGCEEGIGHQAPILRE